MNSEIAYEVTEYEVWAVPGSAGDRLRITTDVELPFDTTDILNVSLTEEGLVLACREKGISIYFTPGLGDASIEIFQHSQQFFIPVLFSEMHFDEDFERTWMALPKPPGKAAALEEG